MKNHLTAAVEALRKAQMELSNPETDGEVYAKLDDLMGEINELIEG